MRRPALALVAVLALASCGQTPQSASPALWQIEAPGGARGWLFGTIHALARPADWRSPAIDRALAASDRIVVEIADPADGAGTARIFAEMSQTPGQPPLSARIEPKLRPALARLLRQGGLKDDGFSNVESWAAALTLAQVGKGSLDAAHGIDRAVLAGAGGKRVVELEGTAGQLALFDALPEAEQRDLLELVVADGGSQGPESGSLAEAWRKGNIAMIEQETRRGLLADPELREALFTGRNRDWSGKIAAMLGKGNRPFVAVGAAHMAGSEGLPAMLAARGYRITRLQ